jgi:hypothetical protein
MEGIEGALLDETSQMSVDMERASDFDSVAQTEDLQRTLHGSRLEKALNTGSDHTLTLVRAALESGQWDQVLPRYEKQVLLAATSTNRAWQHFLDASVIPSASALGSTAASTAQAPSSTPMTRRGAAASASKAQKATTRSKRGSSTPRRRGSEPESTEQTTSDSLPDASLPSREHIETLHTRLRTLISDTLIDEVIFPHERHLELLPLADSIKQEFGLPMELSERAELEPFFTYEDLKEIRETMNDPSEAQIIEYTIPPITDMVPGVESVSIGPSAPVTPGGLGDSNVKGKSKRKIPGNKSREVRALFTDSKSTRKWERLELIGATQEYRDFVNEMDAVLTALKEAKNHAAPFLKPLREADAPDYKDFVETPMDLTTVGRNLENMLYWKKASFEKDLALIFSNARAYYTTPDSTTTLNHANELEAIAKAQLAKLSDLDFTQEKEALQENLAQVLPDVHGPNVGLDCSAAMPTADEAPFDPQADAIKRTNFFKENPTLTTWKSTVKQRLEMERASSDSETGSESTDLFVTPGTALVTPDPLFELPKMALMQSHWRVAASPVYSSLAPELPMVRSPFVNALANPSTVLPECAAHRLVQMISHRNAVLLQRVNEHTGTHGLAPLDPAVERPIPPPEASGSSSSHTNNDEPRITLIEPSIKLVMRTPPPGQMQTPPPGPSSATPSGTSHPNGNKAPATSSSGSTAASSVTDGTQPSGTGSGEVSGASGPASALPLNLSTEPKTAGKTPSKLSALASSTAKMDAGNGDDELDLDEPAAPVRFPFFSEDNDLRQEPLLDSLPMEANSLTNSRLDEETVAELLKQTVGVQLAMSGFQGAHDIALNVLTEVVAAFVARVGFVASTHLSTPGSLLSPSGVLDRTLSEVFPRGISSLKSHVVSETIKSDNCLKLVDPSTFLGWVEASPSLAPCLATQPSNKPTKMGAAPTNPQKAAADAVLTQVIREDKLDEKAMALGETREYYLQQAPFAKRTSSHYAYKPLAYFGATSNIAVGTPSGLHHVVPPTMHPLEAQAKALAAQQAAAHHHATIQQSPNALPPHMQQGNPGQPHQQGVPHSGGPGGMPSPGAHPMPNQMPSGPQQGMGPQGAPGMMRAYPQQQGPGNPSMVGPPGAHPGYPGHPGARLPPGQLLPGTPTAGPKKGQLPGTMGYPQGMSHLPPGYGAAPSPRGPYGQPMNVPGGGPGYAHPGMSSSPMPGLVAAKKTGSPIPPAKMTGAHPRIPDEPSPRGTSAKRKRPQGLGGAAEEDDANESEGRRTRSRRGTGQAYGDEYMYEEEFDDGEDGEPKRKKRKTPAKSAKR